MKIKTYLKCILNDCKGILIQRDRTKWKLQSCQPSGWQQLLLNYLEGHAHTIKYL